MFVKSLFFFGVLFIHNELVTGGNPPPWDCLHVKFSATDTGKWFIPLTLENAKAEKYVSAGHHEQFNRISLYCLKDDPQVCAMYDVRGKLCGMRINYLKETLDLKSKGKLSYKYNEIACFKTGTIFGKQCYYTDMLFTSPENLKSGGATTDRGTDALGDSLWFKVDGNPWTQIPREESKMADMKGVVKQNCYARMGQHYFFNFDNTTPCDTAFPFFTMYDGGHLIGVGVVTFGTYKVNKREWCEDIPPSFVPMIFRSAPDCLKEGLKQFGGIGLHVYFTKNPEEIKCPS